MTTPATPASGQSVFVGPLELVVISGGIASALVRSCPHYRWQPPDAQEHTHPQLHLLSGSGWLYPETTHPHSGVRLAQLGGDAADAETARAMYAELLSSTDAHVRAFRSRWLP